MAIKYMFNIWSIYDKYPLVMTNSLLLNMTIYKFIVDFPMKNGGSFHNYVSLPEGKGYKWWVLAFFCVFQIKKWCVTVQISCC